MSTNTVQTTTCPAWCRTDHVAAAAETPNDDTVWHRQVLWQIDDDRIAISGRSSVELAVSDDDLAAGVVRRFWIWIGGNDALVHDDLGSAELHALSVMFSEAAANLSVIEDGQEDHR